MKARESVVWAFEADQSILSARHPRQIWGRISAATQAYQKAQVAALIEGVLRTSLTSNDTCTLPSRADP